MTSNTAVGETSLLSHPSPPADLFAALVLPLLTMRRSAMARGKKTGGGSRRGIPNRATASAREALGMLVDQNVGDLQAWLDEIKRKEGARAAWECFMSLVEFSVPKLTRAEHHVGLTTFTGVAAVIVDPAEAAQAHLRMVRGELSTEAAIFESSALAAPSPDPVPEGT